MHNLGLFDMTLEELDILIKDLKHVQVLEETEDSNDILLEDAKSIAKILRDGLPEDFLAKNIQMEVDNEILGKLLKIAGTL